MANKPDNRTFTQLMPRVSFGTDDFGDIQGILRSLKLGQFQAAALLADEILDDDRIEAVTSTRVGALKATPVLVKPSDGKRKSRKIAEELGGDDDLPGEWDRMFPPSIVGELSLWGNLCNFAVAEITWEPKDGMLWPRLIHWDTQFVYWDQYSQRYLIQTMNLGPIPLPAVDETPTSDGRWVVWCPRGYRQAWRRGLVRALAKKYLMRAWDERDWARYNELHGQGIIKAIVPTGDVERANGFFSEVANRGAEPVIKCEQGNKAEGNVFDVELVEAVGKTWDTFEAFKKSLDVDIAVLVLGQELTTAVGSSGSRALGDIHNLVRLDKLREDAAIATCLRDQVLTWWAKYNYGDAELAPRPVYDVEPPADANAEAAVLKTLGDGITSLKGAVGDMVDYRIVVEDRGLPTRTEEEMQAMKDVKAEEDAADAEARAQAAPPAPVPPVAPGQQQQDDPSAPPPEPAIQEQKASALGGISCERRTFAGLPIAIENKAGTMRVWCDDARNVIGTTKMLHDYGYVEGVMGSDKEELDVYLGPDENAPDVHVVHQLATPDYKRHDEDKTFLGFPDPAAAKAAYLAHRNDGSRAFGGMSTIPIETFKRKLKRRTGTGKIRASMSDHGVELALERIAQMRRNDTLASIMALAKRERASALKAKSKSGAKRADAYVDGLAAKSIKLAGRTLAVDIVGLKAEIDAATSFEDLQRRIVRAYRGMDPEKLARVVQKARLMAHLAGRLSTKKEGARA